MNNEDIIENTVYVAFLRGINVGGNNKVSMADLKACLEKLGYQKVASHANSGNLIFAAASTSPEQLEAQLDQVFTETFAIPMRVFIRNLDQMHELVRAIPADWLTPLPAQKYDLLFLSRSIDQPEIAQQLRPKPDIEVLIYHPGVLFWSIAVRNFSKSVVSKLIGTALYQEMTIRGPGTVRKTYGLMLKASETPLPEKA